MWSLRSKVFRRNLCRVNGLNVSISREVLLVKRQNLLDAVCAHRGYQPRVVNLST